MPNRTGRAVLASVALLVGAVSSLRAEEPTWSLLLEPMYVDAYGHDQHVLTIHERDFDSTTPLDTATPVNLDTEGSFAPRFELRYMSKAPGGWGLGLDFFWYATSQGRPERLARAGPPGGSEEVVFEAGDRSYISDDPGEELFFRVLDDTDIAAWTVDLYGTKRLMQESKNGLQLQFGLRNADFDNDYHCALGIEGVAGSLIDASSNYGRMMGPMLALQVEIHLGKSVLQAHFGQSLVFGEAELSATTRDFTGTLTDPPVVDLRESFHQTQDVAIPISEFRVRWLYPVTRRFSLGVAANTSTWWDIPVPPGVVPISGGSDLFRENTITYFGLGLAARLEL